MPESTTGMFGYGNAYYETEGPKGFGDSEDKFPSITGDSKLRLIGLAGKARSGKDTIGQLLDRAFGCSLISFAQPIRDGLNAMIPGLNQEHFHGSLKEKPVPWIGKSPRQMMQYLGTEWGRTLVNENLWLLIAKHKIEAAHENFRHVVVTDVRFENEADFIRSLGGVIWHVSRGDAPSVNAHPSEAGVAFKAGDVLIDNNGSLEELNDTVCDEF